jgi:hypothetical protein
MSSSDHIRWGGIAAMAAGVVWVISGILAIVYQGVHAPGTLADYLVEGTFAVGQLLTVVGMVGPHGPWNPATMSATRSPQRLSADGV